MRLKELRDLCRYWQDRLGLPQWTVHTRWMTKAELNDAGWGDKEGHGFCTWDEQHEQALIALRRESSLPIVHTLVHELLHLRLEGHKPCKSGTDINQEKAINAMVKAYFSCTCNQN